MSQDNVNEDRPAFEDACQEASDGLDAARGIISAMMGTIGTISCIAFMYTGYEKHPILAPIEALVVFLCVLGLGSIVRQWRD